MCFQGDCPLIGRLSHLLLLFMAQVTLLSDFVWSCFRLRCRACPLCHGRLNSVPSAIFAACSSCFSSISCGSGSFRCSLLQCAPLQDGTHDKPIGTRKALGMLFSTPLTATAQCSFTLEGLHDNDVFWSISFLIFCCHTFMI